MRMRWPALTCFSTRSVGELKKTIESWSAISTSPAASPSTASAPPISLRRLCRRVISQSAYSALEAQCFEEILELSQLGRIARERAARICDGSAGLIGFVEYHIGA